MRAAVAGLQRARDGAGAEAARALARFEELYARLMGHDVVKEKWAILYLLQMLSGTKQEVRPAALAAGPATGAASAHQLGPRGDSAPRSTISPFCAACRFWRPPHARISRRQRCGRPRCIGAAKRPVHGSGVPSPRQRPLLSLRSRRAPSLLRRAANKRCSALPWRGA
jgi:hypothetical protein